MKNEILLSNENMPAFNRAVNTLMKRGGVVKFRKEPYPSNEIGHTRIIFAEAAYADNIFDLGCEYGMELEKEKSVKV